MNGLRQPLPKARQDQLITQEVPGEMLVYDLNTHEAHCLNPPAAWVWAHCDGRTTVAEMTRRMADEMQVLVTDEVVWLALEQLEKAMLLDGSDLKPAQVERLSRRAVVSRLGVAAALTVPFILTVAAPTAAQAASCLPASAPCAANADCCSNSCLDNGRGGFECT